MYQVRIPLGLSVGDHEIRSGLFERYSYSLDTILASVWSFGGWRPGFQSHALPKSTKSLFNRTGSSVGLWSGHRLRSLFHFALCLPLSVGSVLRSDVHRRSNYL